MRRNSRHQFTSQERSLGGRHSAEHMQRDRYGHFTSRGEEDRGRSSSESRSRSSGGGRGSDRYSSDRNSSRSQSRMPMRDSREYENRYQNDRSDRSSPRSSRDRWAEETDPRSWAYRSPRIRQDDDAREHEGDRGYGSRSSRNDRNERDFRDFGDSNARQGRYNSYREDDARGRFDDNEDNENFYDADEFEQRDTRDRTLSAEHEDEDYEDRDIDDEDRGDLDTRSFSITGPDDVDEDMDNRRIRGLRNEYADENRSSYWQNDWNDRQDQRGSRSRRDERPEFDDRVSDRNLEREYNRGPNSMRNEYAGSSQNQFHGYRARGHGGHGGYRNQ